MNQLQRKTLIGVASLIVFSMIFSPYKVYGFGTNSSAVMDSGYGLIFSHPPRSTVDVVTLLAEWIGICLVGAILFKLFSAPHSNQGDKE